MKSIGQISWPKDKSVALRLYLEFVVRVLTPHDINFFIEPNPVRLTERYLEGAVRKSECERAAHEWWRYLEENASLRACNDEGSKITRLALCLLAAKEDSDLNDQLSWFFETLYSLNPIIQDEAICAMEEFFEFD